MQPIPVSQRTKLNLGCGRRALPDHVNVDLVESVGPDVVHDLGLFPYPFEDSRFEEIVLYDVVEHIPDLVGCMKELWRIGRPGARIRITTPHFSAANSFKDPTHVRHLSYRSLDYFSPDHPLCFYGGAGFSIVHREIIFQPTLVNRVVARLARRWPDEYERRWAWIFPAWFLFYQLQVAK